MDSLWTADDQWTSRPQPAHTRLGQVSNIVDLPTVPWITARMDIAVIHTAHNPGYGEFNLGTKEKDRAENQSANVKG